MPKVFGTTENIAKLPTEGKVWVSSPRWRPGATAVVTNNRKTYYIEEGYFETDDLHPGEVVFEFVSALDGQTRREPYPLVIPDQEGDVDFLELLDDAFEYPEPVVGRAQEAARQARDHANRSEQAAKDAIETVGGAERVREAERRSEAAQKGAEDAEAEARRQAVESERQAELSEGSAQDSELSAGESVDAAGRAKKSEANAEEYATSADEDAKATAEDREAVREDRLATGSARNAAQSAQKGAEEAQGKAEGAAETAGDHAEATAEDRRRAEQAADEADGTAIRAVTERVDELLEGAPDQYDTLKEVADWIAGAEDTGAGLIESISDKSDKGHTHPTSEIDGLDQAVYNKADKGHTHTGDEVSVSITVGDESVETSVQDAVVGIVEDMGQFMSKSSIQVVDELPESPASNVIYLVRE